MLKVQCLSDPGGAFRDKAQGLWRCGHICSTDRPEGERLQSMFRAIDIVVGCDKDLGKDDLIGGRVSSPARNTEEWRLAVLSGVDNEQKHDSNAHARWDCDQVGRKGGHDQACEWPLAGSPTVRESKCQSQRQRECQTKRQRQEELKRWWEWRGSGSQGQTNTFLLPSGRA